MKTSYLVIGIVLLVLLAWGLFGSSKAAEVGTNCDVGIGKDGRIFCWKWHQNIIGEIGDTINTIIDK